jgi:acetate kinase
VAAFDTAFHATLPEVARRYPVPDGWVRDHGIRRYGFHGLSVEWSVGRTASLLGRPREDLRILVAHLGGGASVTAVDGGRSIDTSMGLTPLEGLMMTSRAGSIDPGIVFRLMRDGAAADDIERQLDHESGLVGVGGTSDMRRLLDKERGGDQRAILAIDLFVRRAAAGIAAIATSLPRLDALVFTGGIGEHAATVRSRICARLGLLGVPPVRDGAIDSDAILERGSTGVSVLKVHAREDLVIATETLGVASG